MTAISSDQMRELMALGITGDMLVAVVDIFERGGRSKKPATRGTRLPPDWRPSAAGLQFAREHGVEPGPAHSEFVDYWIAVPGQRGTKLDWDAAWRNRIRQIETYRKEKNGSDRSIVAASDRLNAKLAEFAEPDLLGGLRGPEGASNVRLLPSRRSG